MSILTGTRVLLTAWGSWGRCGHIGLPKMSPMFGERALKTPLYGQEEGPPEMMEIDRAVCRVELSERRLLIERYQWRIPWRIAVRKYHCSRYKYHQFLETAEWAVHVQLQK